MSNGSTNSGVKGRWDVYLATQSCTTPPVGFIFLRGKTETLRLATDNLQCFTSLLSNTVACTFLLRALGNLFQQPFPAWRRIVIRIAHKKGFQVLLCGHVLRPLWEPAEAAGRTCGEAKGKNMFYNSWRTRCSRHLHIKVWNTNPVQPSPKDGTSRLSVSFQGWFLWLQRAKASPSQ